MNNWIKTAFGVGLLFVLACGKTSSGGGGAAVALPISPSVTSPTNGGAPNGGNAATNPAGTGSPEAQPPAGSATGPGTPMGGTMGTTPMMMGGAGGAAPTAEVMVDPADIMSCMGAGAPPDATEQVDVIQIRTGDMNVVPGGYKAAGGTVYACFWVDIDMPEKKHIIGWEGAVGGDRAVHHQQVSISPKPIFLTQQGGLCGLPTVDFTWTGEKPTEWTPKLVGYPVGGPENGGKAHFLWQTHFESATTYSGGFNVYVTKNLRKYDAGNMEQGDVSGILIPKMSSATHVADCTSDMTKQKLTHPIYIYASMQHAHLTVTHIKSELLRDGKNIFTFGDQSVMGFLGFFDQQFKPWNPCIEVRPGDEIKTTCDYTNNNTFDVTGGEGLNQEMCTTFFEYFPRLAGPNNFCGTIDSSGGFGH
jgi:Copper type II ascorbate-dependent monooxygenase, C-terminal domain